MADLQPSPKSAEQREVRHLAVTSDHSPRAITSFMVGVFVAINAIRDAFLLVDGPDCIYAKTQYLQGNQDYLSNLVSVSGFHRISHTALSCVANVAIARDADLVERLTEIARHDEVGVVATTSMPAATVVGIDYARLCKEASQQSGTPTLAIPGKSLSQDWLGGYEETLLALARNVALDEGPLSSDEVALVGYLFDRNEEDNLGNLRELGRALRALGLELGSTWLGGQRYAELGRVGRAGTIVSMPYGRKAARALAKRTGARLLELPLPFGLGASERWVRALGDAFERQDAAERYIDAELRQIVPKLEWVVPFLFQGKSFGYAGDPFLLDGLIEILELLGAQLDFAVVTNFAHHQKGLNLEGRVPELLVEQRLDSLGKWLAKRLEERPPACVISNNTCLDMLAPTKHAIVEFGFPCFGTHALYDRPSLGFGGFLAFVDTLANQLRTFDSLVSLR